MKKTHLRFLTAFMTLAALVSLTVFSSAAAKAESHITVSLGDGAPIPYFDGFESKAVTDMSLLRDITGAAQATWQYAQYRIDGEHIFTCELQNIALTDDVLVAFFLLRSDTPLSFQAGKTQFGYNFEVPAPDWMLNGDWLNTVAFPIQEGHLLDDYTMACIAGFSLAEPLPQNPTLSLAPVFDEKANAYGDGISVSIMQNAASDASVSHRPLVHSAQALHLWDEETSIPFDFLIERVAFTPFGNRVLMNFKSTSGQNAYGEFALSDESGNHLTVFEQSRNGHSLASPEHPVQVRNEIWFFGGEESQALTLLPVQHKSFADYTNILQTIYLPFAQLPTRTELENGAVVTVEACDLTKDGFLISYTTEGLPGYLRFDLANEAGVSTDFNYVTYLMQSIPDRLLQTGGYWSEEYKGKTVSRVSEEALKKATGIILEYSVGEAAPLTENAVTIPLR